MASAEYLQASSASFQDAKAYDAHRPSYPPAAVESLLARLGVAGQPRARIVDLAAGTGKFTELLAARPEGYEILAVEPTRSMRETLAGKGLQGVEVRDGTAEEMMGVGDGWADGVVVAQAFHWYVFMVSGRIEKKVLLRADEFLGGFEWVKGLRMRLRWRRFIAF